jgi:hypothetical protein
MNTLRQYMKRHMLALWIALAAGAISVAPTIIAPLMIQDKYKGVQYLYINDEDTYRSRIHEVLDGHYRIASPHLHEYKDSPSLIAPINEYFYALPAFFFGLSFVVVASKFVFPALLFFLVYLLVAKLAGEKEDGDTEMSAIAAGVLVVLGIDLVDYGYMLSVIQNGAAGAHPLLWTRLVNPIAGGLLFFGFLNFLWDTITSERHYAPFLAGLMSALSVGYFFNYGLSLAILAAALTIFFLQKNYAAVKRIGMAISASFVLSIPYWYGIFSSWGGEAGRRAQERNGMFFTHAPEWNKFLIATTGFFLLNILYARYRERSTNPVFHGNTVVWSFLGVLLLGSWFAFEQQVVTGREIWIPHFVQYTIPLCFIVVIMTVYLVWRKYFPRIWKATILIMLLLSSVPAGMSLASFGYVIPDFKRMQGYGESLSFLNEHAKPECVVLVTHYNIDLEKLIPAYTRCDLYDTYYTYFGVPDERLLHNFLMDARIQGVTEDNMNKYLLAHDGKVRSYYFTNWTQAFKQGKEEWVLERMVLLNEQYKEFMKADLNTQIHKYRIDYIFSEHELLPEVLKQMQGLSFYKKLGAVYVYSFEAR